PSLGRRQDIKQIRHQNALDAIALNKSFASLTPNSSCDPTTQANACVNNQVAQCVGGKFTLTACSPGLQCVALPLLLKSGTSITCDTAADRDARIQDALGSNTASSVAPTATA
ncbi:4669_t:CDS:2, partial [Ambispora leptoticha]